jgi:V/A-type H+-transporting ATPase subunit C
MAELASKFDGVNLIEMGTSRNLARINRQILSFCKGDLRGMVENYLSRWDTWNVKTILRGKYYGATADEIQEDIVAAGAMSEEYLNFLISLNGVNEVLEELRKKEGLIIPDEVRAAYESTGSLGPIEDFLDKRHYENLLVSVSGGSKPQRVLKDFLSKEIDIRNIMTLLKLKRAGLSAERIMPYMIDGGNELSKSDLATLAGLETYEQVTQDLSRVSFYEQIKEPLEKSVQTKSLTDVALAMQKVMASESQEFSHIHPLSVLPIVDFMVRKKIEVDNIRIIARGKESGLDAEQIKKLLVI